MNLVLNGDFESGNFDHWDAHYGYVYYGPNYFGGNEKRRVDYKKTRPNQPTPDIVDALSKLPQQAAPIIPLEGSKMARINDLVGDNHVTCLHQTITLPEDFDFSCAYISFKWAALLGGSNHKAHDRPKFSFAINVKRFYNRKNGTIDKRWKNILHADFEAPDSATDGWANVAAPGEPEAVWFKSGFEKRSLSGLVGGDTIRIRFIAEDCTGGEHGGAAFIDDVRITNGCEPGANVSSPIPDITVPNVFTPNNDGINDVWGLNGVQNTCFIELRVFDRWGDQIFYTARQSFDGTWDPFVGLWNGLIRTRRKLKGIGKRKKYYWRRISQKDMNSGTVFYVVSLKNCHEVKDYNGFISIFV